MQLATITAPAAPATPAAPAAPERGVTLDIGLADFTWGDFASDLITRERKVNAQVTLRADSPTWSTLEDALAGADALSKQTHSAIAVVTDGVDGGAQAFRAADVLVRAESAFGHRGVPSQRLDPLQKLGDRLDLTADLGPWGDVGSVSVHGRIGFGDGITALVQHIDATHDNLDPSAERRPEQRLVEFVRTSRV